MTNNEITHIERESSHNLIIVTTMRIDDGKNGSRLFDAELLVNLIRVFTVLDLGVK
jgi:hypothetical protein